MHRKTLLAVLMLLVGCGVVDGLQGMFEKQQAVAADVDKALGVQSQVSWNWKNGVLTDVTVIIPANQVNGTTTEELIRIVEPIVEKHFEKRPSVLYVALSVSSE